MANTTYTVRPDDTLWKISQTFLGSGARYMEIYNANRGILSNPDQIYPGQVLTIPMGSPSPSPAPVPVLPGKPNRPTGDKPSGGGSSALLLIAAAAGALLLLK